MLGDKKGFKMKSRLMVYVCKIICVCYYYDYFIISYIYSDLDVTITINIPEMAASDCR